MINHDRQLVISTAGSRKSTHWKQQIVWWSEILERLATPARGAETLQEYLSLPKSRQDELKDVGGFVGGALNGERRKAGAVAGRDLITLDLDNIPPGQTGAVVARVEALGCGYAVYSTRKHSDIAPRLRVLAPLNRTVTAEEYEAISRKTAEIIGIELCDPTTFEASRLMYWPNCSADSPYVYVCGDKPFLDADGVLAMYGNWRRLEEWPQVPGAQPAFQKLAAKQGEPTDKPGIVGAFCKVYNVYDAMEKFIPGTYIPCEIPGRLTYTGGSTTGGAVVYDDGKFLFSHHSTDPTSGKLCNAFDLVRIHLFGDKDDDAKPDTPINKIPSYIAMQELTVNDSAVTTHMTQQRYASAVQDFSNGEVPIPAAEDPNWMNKLTINPNTGRPALTIDNAAITLEHDPMLKGKILWDDFSCRALILGATPWNPVVETRWLDNNDKSGIRRYLEKVYGITGKDRIDDAVSLVIHKSKYNAVQDYLKALKWDGIRRLDSMFIDYLGAEDSDYIRTVTRKSLVAAVARAMTPGVKYDTMPVLVGPQGIGKSTMLRYLGKNWYSDSLITFEGKEAQELIQGSWVVEVSELAGMTRSEENAVKSFLSKCEDIYRGAYLPLTEKFPRRCVFFGTTNESEFIRDRTGGRRFWPIKLAMNPPTKNVFDNLPEEVDQIWAEAYLCWQLGESLYLTGETADAAKIIQEAYAESNAKEGTIGEFIEKRVPRDWASYSIGQRKLYWSGEFSGGNNVESVERDRICAAEIYVECLNGELKFMKRQDAMEINAIIAKIPGWSRSDNPLRFGCHGLQKGWKRDF